MMPTGFGLSRSVIFQDRARELPQSRVCGAPMSIGRPVRRMSAPPVEVASPSPGLRRWIWGEDGCGRSGCSDIQGETRPVPLERPEVNRQPDLLDAGGRDDVRWLPEPPARTAAMGAAAKTIEVGHGHALDGLLFPWRVGWDRRPVHARVREAAQDFPEGRVLQGLRRKQRCNWIGTSTPMLRTA